MMEEREALCREWFDCIWFTGYHHFLLGCHGIEGYHSLFRLSPPVLLHHGFISMATVYTSQGADPYPAITRFQIYEVFFQHQSLTAYTIHRRPPLVKMWCLNQPYQAGRSCLDLKEVHPKRGACVEFFVQKYLKIGSVLESFECGGNVTLSNDQSFSAHRYDGLIHQYHHALLPGQDKPAPSGPMSGES